MNYKKLIANGIKQLRETKGLTQERFAEKIGISVPSLSNLERAVHHPKPETIDKICEVFKITPDVLCLSLQKDSSKTDIIRNINIHLNNLNKSQLEQITQIIETFNNK